MKSSSRFAGVWCAISVVALGETVHSAGNIFKPQATPAESVYHLSLLVLTVCAAIFLVVAGLLTFTIVRFRHRKDDGHEPAQVYGSNHIEIAWTVIPILIVFVLTMATARVVVVNTNTIRDRKSTRLNSSHANISYAVFCLKKKIKM